EGGLSLPAGAMAVSGACLCWAIDNNLTQKISAADPLLLASVKGMAAGTVNTGLGLVVARRGLPEAPAALGAMALPPHPQSARPRSVRACPPTRGAGPPRRVFPARPLPGRRLRRSPSPRAFGPAAAPGGRSHGDRYLAAPHRAARARARPRATRARPCSRPRR